VLFGRAVRGPAAGAPTPVGDVGSPGAVSMRNTRMTAIAANRIAPARREPAYRPPFVVLHSHVVVLTHLTPHPLVQRTSNPAYNCLGCGDGFANAGRRLGGTDTDVGRHQDPRDADISETGFSGPAW